MISFFQLMHSNILYALLQKNHLSGLRKSYLKLSFDTVQQLMDVKSDLLHVVERNQAKSDAAEAYESILLGKRSGLFS